MGLCKCPKRKVTNLFCFEHRVNVCEHCLVENHPRCVVQSYLNWLKDCDYSPECKLCNGSLDDGKIVRLTCYDLFHVHCLDNKFKNYPANTAPAGYKCPICNTGVFPSHNEAGRVVDKLRNALSRFTWARDGLGLPMVEESSSLQEETYSDEEEYLHGIPKPDLYGDSLYESEKSSWNKNQSFEMMSEALLNDSTQRYENDATILTMQELSPTTAIINKQSEGDVVAVSRKLQGSTTIDIPQSLRDTVQGRDSEDGEDKYKRRSALTWLKRWLRSRMLKGRSHGYHDINALPKRTVILLIVGVIAFFTFILFATQVGRNRAENDPALDPMLNPNIHIANEIKVGENLVVPNGHRGLVNEDVIDVGLHENKR